jgi:hypothetical protein
LTPWQEVDSIIACVGIGTVPDIDDSTRQAAGGASAVVFRWFLEAVEPYTMSVRSWTKLDTMYSLPLDGSILFSSALPPAPTSVTVTDSIFYNVREGLDSVMVEVVCPPDSGLRNPDSIACYAQLGISSPSIPTAGQKWLPYTPDETLEFWFVIDGAGTFSVSASARGHNDSGYSTWEPNGTNSFDDAGGVAGPSSVAIDSLHNDFTVDSEQDSIRVTVITGSTAGDNIYWVISDTGYVSDYADPAVNNTPYTASTTHTLYTIFEGTEPYRAYLSVWIEDGGSYSSRSTGTRFFGGDTPAADPTRSIKIKGEIKCKGEIKIK